MIQPAPADIPPNPGDTLKRVLVIKIAGMGDFIQSLGAMRVVRATHPSARITLLTSEPFEAFARACPYFDIVEADGRQEDAKGRAELIRRLRAAGYDMVYDFQNNSRTAQYFAGLGGARGPLWSGVADGASHPHANPNRTAMNPFERLAEQLVCAGLSPKPPGDPTGWIIGRPLHPDLSWIRPHFRNPPRFQPEYFSLSGPYVLLIPGSSAEHPEKRWALDGFARLARWLADGGVTPVVVGGRQESDIGAQLLKLEPRVRNLVGRTDLFQLATLSERCLFAVGGETGPMHVAAAAGAPGVCLFQQEWTGGTGDGLRSVWDPLTPLGRSAPSGKSPIGVVYARTLDQIGAEDVMRLAVAMRFTPPGLLAPPVEADMSGPLGRSIEPASAEPAALGSARDERSGRDPRAGREGLDAPRPDS